MPFFCTAPSRMPQNPQCLDWGPALAAPTRLPPAPVALRLWRFAAVDKFCLGTQDSGVKPQGHSCQNTSWIGLCFVFTVNWANHSQTLTQKRQHLLQIHPKVHRSLSCIWCKDILHCIFCCWCCTPGFLRSKIGNLPQPQRSTGSMTNNVQQCSPFSNSNQNHTCPGLATVPFSRWKLKIKDWGVVLLSSAVFFCWALRWVCLKQQETDNLQDKIQIQMEAAIRRLTFE